MTATQEAIPRTLAALGRRASRPQDPVHRSDRQLLGLVPLALVLALVAVLYGVNLHGYPEFINDDEGTYFAQAWTVANKGLVAPYTYWYDHPPVGWIQMALLLEPLQCLLGGEGIPVETAGRGMMTLIFSWRRRKASISGRLP